MILIFCVEDSTSINRYLASLKTNAELSRVSVLFSKIEWECFYLKKNLNMIVLNMDFSIPNIMPRFWFQYMFKKGLYKKSDYKGSIKFLSPKKAWQQLFEE